MNFRKERLLYHFLIVIITIGAFTGVSYAQTSVTIVGVTPSGTPLPASTPAPSGSFDVVATPSGGTITSVVFYRNDVPIATDTTSPYKITQDQLGQETYTYHARAYFSGGAVAESGDYRLSVTTPRILKMGASTGGQPSTTGPSATYDHTSEIQNAVNYLGTSGGGTLLFPCVPPSGANKAIFNIKETIDVPSNVTLQGESAETGGKCRIYWFDPAAFYGLNACNGITTSPSYLHGAPMFRLVGPATRVRFRDLTLYNRASGPACATFGDITTTREDFLNIAAEETSGIEINTFDPYCNGDIPCEDRDPGGNVTDIIIENVSINNFTWGIKAVSTPGTDHSISGIKIRGYRPTSNFRQLYIDARYAYNWDIQNFNITQILEDQGGVEIINAGKSDHYTGDDGELKFLQLSCDSYPVGTGKFCVRVEKHGGLYFRQLHHEGVDEAIIVEDISGNEATNPDPIIMEDGIATGIFKDASMTLYLIGNTIFTAPETDEDDDDPSLDDGQLRFSGGGLDSTVYDCGDLHYDITSVPDPSPSPTPGPDEPRMKFTYSERNRTSFFAKENGSIYPKAHTICPSGINEIGGEYFDSGVLPNEEGLYSQVMDHSTCNPSATPTPCDPVAKLTTLLAAGGSVYIGDDYTFTSTVVVPRGAQIIGEPGPTLKTLTLDADVPLFRIDAPVLSPTEPGASGIVIRNLHLKAEVDGSGIGIQILGAANAAVGVSRDLHFSGLTFEGFDRGIEARNVIDPGPPEIVYANPMINGISLKDMKFINNNFAVDTSSQNASNWNIMNLDITSNELYDEGWYQTYGVHQGMQDVRCTGGSEFEMTDCIRLRMSTNFFLNGLRETQDVTNDLNVGVGGPAWLAPPYNGLVPTTMTLRNNDFTSATNGVKLDGRAFITSMNNDYQNFSVSSSNQANKSRLTYCNDTYPSTPYSTSLENDFLNLWVGHDTPTRMECGTRPVPWDDAVRWTYNAADNNVGTPLVGNFFDDTKEDFLVYVADSTSRFLAQQPDGPGRWDIEWGSATYNDKPLVGKFFPASSRSQIVVYRPAMTMTDSEWRALDPQTCNFGTTPPSSCTTYTTWSTGAGDPDDIPFTGNFFDESGTGNMDEIGVYRPLTNDFLIVNPTTTESVVLTPVNGSGDKIQVGDFLGKGYDQVAQYNASNGDWYITDSRSPYGEYTANVAGVTETSGDLPVSGKYLATTSGKDPCVQVGIWRPSEQKFYIAEVNPTPYGGASARNCDTRNSNMVWGSYGDFGVTTPVPDIPLTIRGAGGLRRPTTYRPTKGAFPHSIADGQWWVHDLFP